RPQEWSARPDQRYGCGFQDLPDEVVSTHDRKGAARAAPFCLPQATFARSRNANFWILPVEVFGSGPNITARGTLKRARWPRQKAMISSAVALASGLRVTKAQGVSPQVGSGRATTAASRIAG